MAIYFPPEQRTNTGLITQLLSMFLGGMANKQAGIDQAAASKALEGIVAPNTGTNLSLNDMPMKAPSLNLSSPSLSGAPSSAVGGMYGGSPLSMSGMPAAPPASPDTGWTSTPTSTPKTGAEMLSALTSGGNFDIMRKSPEAMNYLDQMIKGTGGRMTPYETAQIGIEKEKLAQPKEWKPTTQEQAIQMEKLKKEQSDYQTNQIDLQNKRLDIEDKRNEIAQQRADSTDVTTQRKLDLQEKELGLQSKKIDSEIKRNNAIQSGSGKISAFKEKVDMIEGRLKRPLTGEEIAAMENIAIAAPDEPAGPGFWSKVKGLFSKKSAPGAGQYKVGETRVINGVTVTRQADGQWL